MTLHHFLAPLLLLLFIQPVHPHSNYLYQLPNAQTLGQHPELDHLGHLSLKTKQLSWFGFDFAGQGYLWTEELCFLDSDSDGQSNGLELGDPSCTWVFGKPNPTDAGFTHLHLSHPGDPLSTTNRTMDPTLQAKVIYHTPTVPHSGYTSLGYVLVPLGLAGVLGLLISNVACISQSNMGRQLLQRRVGVPTSTATRNNAYQPSPSSLSPNGTTPPPPSKRAHQCTTCCKSEFDAKSWALDLLIGEFLFLCAVVVGLTCLVINKQWNGKYRVANTLGQLAGTLCFLVVLPASRSAVWVWVFGIPFERAIKWHRLFGKLFVASTYLHVIVILWRYGPRMLADTIQWGPTVDAPYPYWGLVSGIGTFLIGLTAAEAIRRKSFELFYYVHVPMVQVVAVGAIFHAPGPEYRYPVVIAMVLYFIDVLGRVTWRSVNVVRTEIIEANCAGVVKLRVVTRDALTIGPGDYFFLRFPQLSLLQSHPFSVSSIGPHPNDINFVIKSMGKDTFTEQLRTWVGQSSSSNGGEPLRTAMEGPYGQLSLRLEEYKELWVCCGGIGAAPMINILLQLHERVMANDATLQGLAQVHFCWVVRSTSDLKWYREELARVKQSRVYEENHGTTGQKKLALPNEGRSATKFFLHLYVTGSANNHTRETGKSMLLEEDEEIDIELPSMMEVVPMVEVKGEGERKDDPMPQEERGEHSGAGTEYKEGRPLYGSLFGGAQRDPDKHAALLACGPSSMVRACQRAAMLRNWDVHKETFEF